MVDVADAAQRVEKRASWAELFFDLVFVFAVTEVSALIGRDSSWGGLLRALVVFVPIYWLWVGTSIQTNMRDISRSGLRLAVFGVALAAVLMALSLPEAYGGLGLLYALAYWAGRILLGTNTLLLSVRRRSFPVNPYTVSMVVTGPLLVIGALLEGGGREALWGLAAALDLSSPTILRSRLRGMHVDAAHLTERFGLFVLIALGESVVAIGASADAGASLTFAVGSAVAAAYALSCGLWWVHFHFAADAIRHSLATARVQLDVMRFVLSYGHLAFIASIIVVSVGMRAAVAHPGDRLGADVTGLLFGGTARYLATFGFTRWTMFRLVSVTRLSAAAAVAALIPLAVNLPALASLTALAVVVAVLNVIEMARVQRTGWRARLSRRRDAAEARVDT